MRKLYITAKAHMDPAWRRCFEDHFEGNEWKGVVRPYSELEEKQVLEYMDLAEKYGVKYQIEQSITVRKVLELDQILAAESGHRHGHHIVDVDVEDDGVGTAVGQG